MIKAELARQLMVRGDNEIGMLAQITRVISKSEINLVALLRLFDRQQCGGDVRHR